jgi:uncharacterized protein
VIELTRHDQGTVLLVRAQPNARRNGVLGERSGALRVGVTAAPEQGKANVAIVEVLAKALGCRSSGLVLLTGQTSRDKRILVLDMAPEGLQARLGHLIPSLD